MLNMTSYIEYLSDNISPEIVLANLVLARLERINVYNFYHKHRRPHDSPNWLLRDIASFLCERVCTILLNFILIGSSRSCRLEGRKKNKYEHTFTFNVP